MFPLVLSAQLVVAGGLFAFGLLHFLIGLKHPDRRLHLTFSLTAFFAMIEALSAGWRYHPSSAGDLVLAMKLSGSSQFAFGLGVVWFTAFFRGAKDFRVPWLLTGGVTVLVALHSFLPYGVLLESLPELKPIRLLWGEEIITPVGRPSRALIWAHLTSTGLVGYVVYSCYRLWKEQSSERVAVLTLSYAPLLLIAWPHGLLINRGFLTPPYLYSFAFLALIALMSLRMVKETVLVANLASAVESHNRRWSMLLENIHLPVVGCAIDGSINYVNPCFMEITGFKRQELLGLHYSRLLDTDEHGVAAAQFQRILDGLPVEYKSLRVRRHDGERRTILWSSVCTFDEQGATTGILNVGFDITTQQEAELARDEAIRKLEEMTARLQGENLYLREEIGVQEGVQTIIGQSPGIRYVVNQIKMVAKTKATVLIEGETGVGKELVARAVHELSDRSSSPFIGLNCAAMSSTLVEAELFGAEKGAYTGADRQRKGRFELADGGTLFLDEVGELSLDVQAKLLRVLQEGEFERLGGQQTRRIDVRIIAATNRNLQAEIAAGRFREDLYYRLGVYPITLPPLRERREDIPLLVQHLAAKFAARHGKVITEVPSHAVKLLMEWDWPGNIRELANVIERAVILTDGSVLGLPPGFGRPGSTGTSKTLGKFVSLAEMERNYLREVLESTNWKIQGAGGAAEILDIHPNTLRSRLAKIGLTKQIAPSSN